MMSQLPNQDPKKLEAHIDTNQDIVRLFLMLKEDVNADGLEP